MGITISYITHSCKPPVVTNFLCPSNNDSHFLHQDNDIYNLSLALFRSLTFLFHKRESDVLM